MFRVTIYKVAIVIFKACQIKGQLQSFKAMHISSFVIMHVHHHNGEDSLVKMSMLGVSTDIKMTGFHCDDDSSPSSQDHHYHYCYWYFISIVNIIITVIIIFNIIITLIIIAIIITIVIIIIIIIIYIISISICHWDNSIANWNAYLGILSFNHDHYFLTYHMVISKKVFMI